MEKDRAISIGLLILGILIYNISIFFVFLFYPLISLPSLVSIFLAILPISKYKLNVIRITAAVFCGIMFFVLIYSVGLLINLPPNLHDSDIMGFGHKDIEISAGWFGITASIYSIIFILIKIRRSLQELRKEGKSINKKYIITPIILIPLIGGAILGYYLFNKKTEAAYPELLKCGYPRSIPFSSIDSNCYSDVAEIHQDPSICDKLCELKDDCFWCYKNVAVAKKDPLICDKIQNQLIRNFCYEDIAEVNQDLSICDKVEGQESKEYCYMYVAAAKQDLSICEDKIQFPRVKDRCYKWVADKKQDPTICDKIQDQEEKDQCYRWTK